MTKIEETFANEFRHSGFVLPASNVELRQGGKIIGAGWAIWYCFGEDEYGQYLDYYASHRMTNDRHCRIYADGRTVDLPSIRGMYVISGSDPMQQRAEFCAWNDTVLTLLRAKGFRIDGDEPGGVVINMHLRTGGKSSELLEHRDADESAPDR